MKKALLIFGAAALIVFASSVVWAVPTIDFIENSETVKVEFSGFGSSPQPSVSGGTEYGKASGDLSGLVSGVYATMLTEPAGDPKAGAPSDILFVVTTRAFPIINKPSSYKAWFVSDGLTTPITIPCLGINYTFYTFEEAVGIFNIISKVPGVVTNTFPETGDLQNLVQLNSTLLFRGQSDVAAVPIPGAVLLLGAGLARLTAYARRRRQV